MSTKMKKNTMAEQLSLPLLDMTSDHVQLTITQNNVVMFGHHHSKCEFSKRDLQKRELIINKLIAHADKLGW